VKTELPIFGLCRHLENHFRVSASRLPVYMAPEVFQGAPASVESDIYAVGALLFFLVTGKHPSGLSVSGGRDAADGGQR
jgi:serine/threonine protein kinase